MKTIFDMETNDPDDYLTLLFLLGHPLIDLIAVTITPGSAYQVGLVRRTLQMFQKDIPVGAYNIKHEKVCVSAWHGKAYGKILPDTDAEVGAEVLYRLCDEETTLITGAPLKNLGVAMRKEGFKLGRLVAQGGFAGEGVVPPENQLEKFKGKVTCPSFNPNGDPKAFLQTLTHEGIKERFFVSKNVCHGLAYDEHMHEKLTPLKDQHLSLSMIWQGMDHYLSKRPQGKLMHDPLAACCSIDPSIGEWKEVELYRSKGEWGAKLAQGTNSWIIIKADHQRFFEVFTEAVKNRGADDSTNTDQT